MATLDRKKLEEILNLDPKSYDKQKREWLKEYKQKIENLRKIALTDSDTDFKAAYVKFTEKVKRKKNDQERNKFFKVERLIKALNPTDQTKTSKKKLQKKDIYEILKEIKSK